MSIKKRYIKALKNQLGQAPIWPPTNKLALGDFGLYSRGKFELYGNIFEELNLNLEDFIRADNIRASLLVQSEGTFRTLHRGQIEAGKVELKVDFDFSSKRDYVIQLYQYTTESIALEPDLMTALVDNLDNLGWRKKYRIVQQRMLTENINYAFSMANNASLKLKGKAPIAGASAVAEGVFEVTHSNRVNAESWLESGEGAPVVNLIRFKKRDIAEFEGVLLTADVDKNERINKTDNVMLVFDNSDPELEEDTFAEEIEHATPTMPFAIRNVAMS